ncbi:hypothetical protein HNV12_01695 [Methanococcoides sp. SA1]|nr:hypothetical protein [Methanococcoides sp. SA1]
MVYVSLEMFLHLAIILVYSIGIVWSFFLYRNMKKKRLKTIHYFIVGVSLILVLVLFHLMRLAFPVLENSVGFLQGSQMLLIFSGFLFFKGLLEVYKVEVSD